MTEKTMLELTMSVLGSSGRSLAEISKRGTFEQGDFAFLDDLAYVLLRIVNTHGPLVCDWWFTNGPERIGECGRPAAVRYRQLDGEAWHGRCAGAHADDLHRDVVTVEVIS